ncbi:MAG: flavodoxin domain-containing protein [Methanotrichaceae archaeon]|nr:flavodoxin domain-containing protein [Methanotrichaceae archaeon]
MPKIAIIYGSGLGRTKHMAETIAEGAKTVEGVDIILMDAYDVKIEDVKDSDAFVLGGSTYNYKLIKSMDPFLKDLEKLDLKGKVGAAFGSYGWSGEGVPTLIKKMKSLGMNVIEPGVTAYHVPDKAALERCFHFGRAVAMGLTN